MFCIDINLIKYIDEKPKGKFGRLFWWFHKRPHDHYLFMKKTLKENDYSVIHSFKEYYSWPFFKAAKEAGIGKRILHRNINPEKPRQLINRVLESKNRRLSIKYASSLVGVSEICCKNAYRKREYTVLYNSYDEQKYNANVENRLSNGELVITQVASYSDNKNQLFSLQVLKELKKQYANTKLNLIGASGTTPYYQELIKYVKFNGLESDVSFIDRSDSVEKIYEKTTFVIVPSFREGFSLVAVEAQACGINVLASSSVPKEIDCGGVTFIDLREEPGCWAKKVHELFEKYKNTRKQFAVSNFTFKKFKEELIKLYKI